tara:strand:+ start:25361 stop:25666 length:306 start_codon:yes stop_codon:yes gene_type:complete
MTWQNIIKGRNKFSKVHFKELKKELLRLVEEKPSGSEIEVWMFREDLLENLKKPPTLENRTFNRHLTNFKPQINRWLRGVGHKIVDNSGLVQNFGRKRLRI